MLPKRNPCMECIHATHPLTRKATFWPLQVKDVLAHTPTAHLPRHLTDNNFSLFSFLCRPWVWDRSCQLHLCSYTVGKKVMERCGVQEQHPGVRSALKYRCLGNPNEILDSPFPRRPSPHLHISYIIAIYSQTGSVNLPPILQFKLLLTSQIAALEQSCEDSEQRSIMESVGTWTDPGSP